MTSELSDFAARLRQFIGASIAVRSEVAPKPVGAETSHSGDGEAEFSTLALDLFSLQFGANPVYRRLCEAKAMSPGDVQHWAEIPAMPTPAFKEFDVTCLPPEKRTHVFHSSGTTEQQPSRHFHCQESLAVYEAALWPWFVRHVLPERAVGMGMLTPPPAQCPNSSLVHMFETVRSKLGAEESVFLGRLGEGGAWELDLVRILARLREACDANAPLVLLGTAFSFVHLLDFLSEEKLRFALPPGSRVMETGGYKGRSRTLAKLELHELITGRLGIPPANILCEYGMSELSSQAYDAAAFPTAEPSPAAARVFHFPPWVREQIISPETGGEVVEGETGLLRVFDLANVFSVMAVQTEDLGVRRGDGFELLGRARQAEPRGCSLMPT